MPHCHHCKLSLIYRYILYYTLLSLQGEVTQRAFTDVRLKVCPTEAFAREQFKRNGVEHYWNLAYSNAILQTHGVDV